MKNKIIPDKKEWDNIVIEAFSSEKQHDFSVVYELQKAEIQKGITMKKTNNNYIKKRYTGMVAAAAAIVIAIPVSVYAFSSDIPSSIPSADTETPELSTQTVVTPEEPSNEVQSLGMQLEKNGKYQYILRYTPTEEETSDDTYYDVEYTWLPEGTYTYKDEGGVSIYITGEGGKISPNYFHVSGIDPMTEELDGVVQYADVSDKEKNVYVFKRQYKEYLELENNMSYSRIAWIQFKNTNFVVELTITDDVSDEELKNIIFNMKLIPSDTQVGAIWFNRRSTSGSSNVEPAASSKSIDDFNIVNIGDTVTHEDGFGNDVEITLDNAWVQDNFDGISTDGCGMPVDYSEFLGEDGKIYETHHYGTIGDGKNTLDEIKETLEVQKKVIVLELTYKNIGDTDIYEDMESNKLSYGIFPNLLKAPEWECSWRINRHKGDLTRLNLSKIACEDYLSLEADNHGSKNSINIPAGGETHVKVSLLADADDLDDLYVDFTGHALYPQTGKNTEKPPILSVKAIK